MRESGAKYRRDAIRTPAFVAELSHIDIVGAANMASTANKARRADTRFGGFEAPSG